jgi:ParB/RepB/Spo0J family partition protein
MDSTDDFTEAEPSADPTPEFHSVVELPIDQIECNPWNPNTMNDATFKRLVQELDATAGGVGFVDPIQVVQRTDGKYRILGGEHRYHAAKTLGWTKLQAVVLRGDRWEDEDLQKFVTVRLNVLRGKLNPERMASLYDEMATKYGADALSDLMAYTDQSAWEKTLKEIGRGIKASLPSELADKFDAAATEIKTVDDLSNVMNELFANYGSTLDKNFIVFTFGGQEHVYIALDSAAKKAVDALTEHCQKNNVDINSVIGPVTAEWVKKATPKDI